MASGVQAPDSGPGERERPFERQDEVPRIDAALAFEARRHVGTAGDHRNELSDRCWLKYAAMWGSEDRCREAVRGIDRSLR